MKATNALTVGFLRAHPGDAARALERLSGEVAATLLEEVPLDLGVRVCRHLLPGTAAGLWEHLSAERGGALLEELALSTAGHIVQAMERSAGEAALARLPKGRAGAIRKLVRYPRGSAGAAMSAPPFLLPDDVTVEEALRRIRRWPEPAAAEFYVVDAALRLSGVVEAGNLLKARPRAILRTVMQPAPAALPARAPLDSLSSLAAWRSARSLPVVDGGETPVGTLSYARLLDAIEGAPAERADASTDSVLAIAGAYWLVLAEMLNVVLANRGRR